MISKLQHLQFAKPHPSTHVASTKSVAPNMLVLGHQTLKTFVVYPSDRARVSSQIVAAFLSFFFFFFFFFLEDFIGLLFSRALNLLQVVNETRVGF